MAQHIMVSKEGADASEIASHVNEQSRRGCKQDSRMRWRLPLASSNRINNIHMPCFVQTQQLRVRIAKPPTAESMGVLVSRCTFSCSHWAEDMKHTDRISVLLTL